MTFVKSPLVTGIDIMLGPKAKYRTGFLETGNFHRGWGLMSHKQSYKQN